MPVPEEGSKPIFLIPNQVPLPIGLRGQCVVIKWWEMGDSNPQAVAAIFETAEFTNFSNLPKIGAGGRTRTGTGYPNGF